MSTRKFVFSMTEAQAVALLNAHRSLEEFMKRGTALDRALNALDEQLAAQNRPWERCEGCNGSGWVES